MRFRQQKYLLKHLISFFCFICSQAFENIVEIQRNCGGNYTGFEGYISSPYFGVSNYEANTECTWIVSVPESMVVRMHFDSMNIEDERRCSFDGVVLYDYTPNKVIDINNYADNSQYIGKMRFCGSDRCPTMTSKTSKIGIKFYSDSDNEEMGFRLQWNAVPRPSGDSFNCTFDQALCAGWRDLDSSIDKFNWTLNAGATSTGNTGPQFDHTMQNKNGKYLYIETSYPRNDNDFAMLESPVVPFDSNRSSACLSFWYHMDGYSLGMLLVAKNETGYPIIWMQKGEQGNAWKNGKVNLPKNISNPFRVIFIGVKGSGLICDIAIDDITVSQGDCIEEIGNLSKGKFLNDFLHATGKPPSPPSDIICPSETYRCISQTACIPKFLLCDGHNDCPDKDDEFGCPTAENEMVCASELYQCISGTKCISRFSLCDGHYDCPDEDDEVGCPPAVTMTTTTNADLHDGVSKTFRKEAVSPATSSTTLSSQLNTEQPYVDLGPGSKSVPTLVQVLTGHATDKSEDPIKTPPDENKNDNNAADKRTGQDINEDSVLGSPTKPSQSYVESTTSRALRCDYFKRFNVLTPLMVFAVLFV